MCTLYVCMYIVAYLAVVYVYTYICTYTNDLQKKPPTKHYIADVTLQIRISLIIHHRCCSIPSQTVLTQLPMSATDAGLCIKVGKRFFPYKIFYNSDNKNWMFCFLFYLNTNNICLYCCHGNIQCVHPTHSLHNSYQKGHLDVLAPLLNFSPRPV